MSDLGVGTLTARASDFLQRSSNAPQGGMFHAKVLDFYDGRALLDVDGKVVTAESEVPLKLNGEFDVLIKGVDKGQVQLQIVWPEGEGPVRPMSDEALASRLMGFDIPETETAIQTARSLMREGLPVNKQNVLTILTNLPQNPKPNEIDFLVALMREELPISREILDLIPSLARDTQQMPAAAKAVIEWALSEPETAQLPAAAPLVPEDATVRSLANLPLAPETETTDALRDKIELFVKNFLQPTPARLAAAVELTASPSQESAPQVRAFSDQLLSLLTLTEQSIPDEFPPEIRNALQTIIRNMQGLQLPEKAPSPEMTTFSSMREEIVSVANTVLASEMTPREQLDMIHTQTLTTLSQVFDSLAAPLKTESATASPSLPLDTFQLPKHLDAAVMELVVLQNLLQSGDMSQPEVRQAVQRLAAEMLPLLTLRPPVESYPAVNQFLDDTARLLAQILKPSQPAQPAQTAQAPAPPSEEPPQAMPSSQLATREASERILLQTRTPAFQDESRALANSLREFPDIRAMMAEALKNTQTQPGRQSAEAIMSQFGRTLDSTALANILMNDGNRAMDAMVTAFPIRFGNHVEVGLLKVFRERDREGRTKNLDPENASLVLLLDTDFLGPSLIHIRTHRKGLHCAIEVESPRKKRLMEKYLPELIEGLKGTPFDLRDVEVRVKRRKSNAPAAEIKEKQPTTIDLTV